MPDIPHHRPERQSAHRLTNRSRLDRQVTSSTIVASALVSAGLLSSHAALAQATAPQAPIGFSPSVSFSGFGTLGFAVLDDEHAEYRSGEARDGADRNGSFELDTRLGLQLDTTLSRRFSGTLQVIARDNEVGEPEAVIEWGLIRFLATDSTAIRVGRMSLPVFGLSDYREVGHANVMLRPPEDVYVQIPLRRFDGADVTVDTEFGDTLLRTQLFAGQARERINDRLEPDARDSLGISMVAEHGPFRIRLAHVSSRLELDSTSGDIARVHAGIVQASAQLPQLAVIEDDFAPGRVALRFDALGFNFDSGTYFVDTEYARRRVDSWVSNIDSWFVAAGFRYRAFTPYAFASALDEVDGDRRIALPDSPGLNELEAGVNAFYEPRDQRTVGVGLRWDILPNIALKTQIERVSRDVTGISLLRREVDDGRDEGEDVMLYSATIDFVF